MVISFPLIFIFLNIMKADNQLVRITFLVSVPNNTPKDDIIYITGNHKKLGSWQPNKIKLNKVGRKYQITFTIKKGVILQYKFTRGSWKTVEKDEHFHELTFPIALKELFSLLFQE